MNLLEIKDLTLHYETEDGCCEAVSHVDLHVEEGETLGLVGETGAGKTTTALSILGLVDTPPSKVKSGEILFRGKDLLKASPAEMRKIRGNDISMIFQDPMSALNPIMRIGDQISEVIKLHNHCSTDEAVRRSMEMLEMVGIRPERSVDYPHQLSGGMKQRVMIAIALACNPSLLIADEPTTALDVTIQAQVLEMINELKVKLGTSVILITHDLGVVAECCQRVAVMYAGEIVECGTLQDIFKETIHPYTKGLFDSIPSLNKDVDRLKPIAGLVPDPANLPTGCHFHPRCPYADSRCAEKTPPICSLSASHMARCFHCSEQRKATGKEANGV